MLYQSWRAEVTQWRRGHLIVWRFKTFQMITVHPIHSRFLLSFWNSFLCIFFFQLGRITKNHKVMFLCVSLLLFLCDWLLQCASWVCLPYARLPFRRSLWVTWVVPAARGWPLPPSGRVDKFPPPPVPVTPLRLPRPRVNGSTGKSPLIAPGQQSSPRYLFDC